MTRLGEMQRKHPSIEFIGQTVRQRRLAIGLSQEDMADRVGVHRTYYSSLERGAYNFTVTVLFRLAVGLECEPSDLLPPRAMLANLPPIAPRRGRPRLV